MVREKGEATGDTCCGLVARRFSFLFESMPRRKRAHQPPPSPGTDTVQDVRGRRLGDHKHWRRPRLPVGVQDSMTMHRKWAPGLFGRGVVLTQVKRDELADVVESLAYAAAADDKRATRNLCRLIGDTIAALRGDGIEPIDPARPTRGEP